MAKVICILSPNGDLGDQAKFGATKICMIHDGSRFPKGTVGLLLDERGSKPAAWADHMAQLVSNKAFRDIPMRIIYDSERSWLRNSWFPDIETLFIDERGNYGPILKWSDGLPPDIEHTTWSNPILCLVSQVFEFARDRWKALQGQSAPPEFSYRSAQPAIKALPPPRPRQPSELFLNV